VRGRLRRIYQQPRARTGQAIQLLLLRCYVWPTLWWRLRGGGRVVLIHQMGKTGSKAIEETLRGTPLGPRTFHTHFLHEAERTAIRAERKKATWSPPKSWVVSEVLLRRVLARPDRFEVDVVSPIREPIARNVSSYFYSLPAAELDRLLGAEAPATSRLLLERFLADFDHERSLTWLDRELTDQLGFDLGGLFDVRAGFSVYEGPAGRRLLIVRQEDLNRSGPLALRRFLRVDVDSIRTANDGSSSTYGDLYRQFLQTVALPDSYIERMYRSPYARHYYSDEELARFATKWARPPAPTTSGV
jgi:hypothetical protein